VMLEKREEMKFFTESIRKGIPYTLGKEGS
jgi:hypothetical protein